MNHHRAYIASWLFLGAWLLIAFPARANVPGGGTNGPNVTLTDNGSSVTLANGIVSLVCTKSGATINQINYTYNNGAGAQTQQLLSGGTDSGKLYWENSTDEGLSFTYTLVANPANTGGNYAEIAMYSTSTTNDALEVHFSLLRGSTGFYTSAIYSHVATNAAFGMGECRDNIYAGSIFNWMSVDSNRNKLMEVSGGQAVPVRGAPVECSLWTNGIYQGQYEDKYKYSADLGVQRVWGWSSVGATGKNVGLWNISASAEYYNGGPLKRELMSHIGTTILNMLNGGHYGMGTDGAFATGEVWSKLYGPYFIYCNSVSNTLTGMSGPANALYNDALAQAAAEESAWPYSWFTNANYAPASNRGTVTGQIAINDSGNPNASAAGLWVGLVQQPATAGGVFDFQQWMKPYQFWVRTDPAGNFTLSNVIAGDNYTLYAFGPGAPDTFMSQNQSGGTPPIIVDVPPSPFAVSAPAGGATNLGTIVWTPARVGPTVFEIGFPDRMADKFRHGEDYWVGDIGPGPTAPSPIWSKWLEYQFDFPNGPNYVVGQSRWTTDWNFIQPVFTDSQGNYDNSSSTISFNLAAPPANGSQASIYIGLASDYYSAIVVTVNGNNLGGVSGVVGTPNNTIPASGYYAGYGGSDTSIREGNNGAFSDERLTFPGSQLHQGLNTINIGIRQEGGSYFADHAMYDYIRLELTGYVPPAPATVTAYPGNNCNLVCWPVTPGAASYGVLRSTSPAGPFVYITNGVAGPVCGSGSNNAVFLDATALNGSTYFYQVGSSNSIGASAVSPASPAASPSAALPAAAPAAPTGLAVAASGHQFVSLTWLPSSGAAFYNVWRSTLANTGGGSSNTLRTIILSNTNSAPAFTDGSPTDGSIYQYFVTAASPGGASGPSAPVVAAPLPAAPASLPASLTASFTQTTNVTLNWSAVSGAVGYAIYRSTSSGGPYTYLQTVTELTYTDTGLNPATIYYYRVAAVNAAAASPYDSDSVNSQQVFPPALAAAAANAQIILTWTAAANASSYTVKRGTASGNETTAVVSGYAGTTYTNASLVNGTTYYYVVTAAGPGGASGNSPEASATPFANNSGIWINAAGGAWGAAANWSGGAIASGPGSSADFSTLSLPANVTVTLDSPRAISALKFGDASDAYNWILAGSNTLTLGTSPQFDILNQTTTLATPVAGSNGMVKSGQGTLVIGGASNTLAGGLTINAGNVVLDFTASNSPVAGLLPATNALILGGGALQINGSANQASSQTFSATTLNAGSSLVTAAPVSGNTDPVLNLGAFTAKAGGVIEFVGPPTIGAGGSAQPSNSVMTTAAAGNSAFVGASGTPFFDANFATVGLYDFAAAAGFSPPYVIVGGSQVSGFYTTANGVAGTSGNLDVTGNIANYSTEPFLTSLRFNTSIGANLTFVPYSGVLTLSDILDTPNVGAYNVTFTSGDIRPAGGSSSSGGPFVVWQNNTAGELIFNGTIGNPKTGAAAYVQSGPGTVWINNTASGYTGLTYLNGGSTLINGNGALGPPSTAASVNLNGGAVVANGTFALDNGGATPRAVTLLANGGGLAATAGNTLTVDGVIGSAAGAGPLTIGIPASSANHNTAGLLPGAGPGSANATPVYAAGTVALTNANNFTGGAVLQSGALLINGINALGGANYGGLVFNGGTLQYAPNFSGNNGSADLTSAGSAGVKLADGGGAIDLNGNSVTFSNSFGASGGSGGSGGGPLTIKSSIAGGVLNLQGANVYAGATTLTNATLLIDNLNGSATGSGSVLVQNGGILEGTGAVGGPVTVGAGGVLMPGQPFGALTLGGSLTLAAGSATIIQIQHPPLASAALSVSATFNAGGALVVTNIGPQALANGDSFQLASAAAFSGAFSNLVLPALPASLLWNTNTLVSSGSLSVVMLTPPAIASAQFNGPDLAISGGGGINSWPYIVLAATNLAAPQWQPVATNQFDSNGNFTLTLTNAINQGAPQVFYKLQLQ